MDKSRVEPTIFLIEKISFFFETFLWSFFWAILHEDCPRSFLQSPFPLRFNDYIYHEGNISKMPDFDVFSLFWNVKNVKVDLMVNVKMATLSAKFVLKNA